MSSESHEVSFREVQRFRQLWLWSLLAVSLAPLVVLGPFWIAFALLVAGFVWSFRLTTEVRPDGLYVKFWPFHLSFRHVHWSEMETVEAVTYRPIREYGGWGIRWTPGKLAYNVSGSQGVRIEREDGHELLVGSRREYDLARAIRDAARNAGH